MMSTESATIRTITRLNQLIRHTVNRRLLLICIIDLDLMPSFRLNRFLVLDIRRIDRPPERFPLFFVRFVNDFTK
jgi:hypothetical protein